MATIFTLSMNYCMKKGMKSLKNIILDAVKYTKAGNQDNNQAKKHEKGSVGTGSCELNDSMGHSNIEQ